MNLDRHESYMYRWAETIKPLQRELSLLFSICDKVEDSHKIVLMTYIRLKREHLTDMQTLSTYGMSVRQNIKERETRKNPNRIRDWHCRLKADEAMYNQTRKILVGYNNMLSPTDRRINKKMYNSCRGMAMTCRIMRDLED